MAKITTAEQYETVRAALKSELAKPKDKQDARFMRDAIAALQETGGKFDRPAEPQFSTGEALKRMPRAALETILTSMVGMGNQLGGTLAGVKGAVDPNDTYMDARNRRVAEGEAAVANAPNISPEGRAMMGGLATGAENSGLSAGLDMAGDAIEAVGNVAGIGPELRDVSGTAALLATMRTPKKVVPTTPGELAVVRMRANGFIVPPGTPTGTGTRGQPLYAGSRTERTAAGVAGTSDIENVISMHNQGVAQKFAARAGGLPEGQVTPGGVARATAEANRAYDNIKEFDVPVLLPLPEYNHLLKRIQDLVDNTNPLRGAPNGEIRALQQLLLNPKGARVSHFVDRIKELRDKSFRNAQTAKTSGGADLHDLSVAQRQAADILEDALDSFLSDTAATFPDPGTRALIGKLHQDWTTARSRLSTLHVIRDAMNPETGALDASVIAKAGETVRLHPDLQRIAEAYAVNPKALRAPEMAARTAASPISRIDAISLGFGATIGTSAAAAGGNPYLAMMGALSPMLARLAARQYALRGPTARAVQRETVRAVRAGARGTAALNALKNVEDEDER